jgi:arylsulfatase A-like enzyme
VPGLPVQRSQVPVSLLDVYPTLLRLCSLATPAHELDGVDLSAILAGRSADRGKPVLSTWGQGNHAIRDARFRYIRYRNGDEELYDHSADPHEWRNLATESQFDAERRRLARWLPTVNAPGVKEEKSDDRSRWTDEAFR